MWNVVQGLLRCNPKNRGCTLENTLKLHMGSFYSSSYDSMNNVTIGSRLKSQLDHASKEKEYQRRRLERALEETRKAKDNGLVFLMRQFSSFILFPFLLTFRHNFYLLSLGIDSYLPLSLHLLMIRSSVYFVYSCRSTYIDFPPFFFVGIKTREIYVPL